MGYDNSVVDILAVCSIAIVVIAALVGAAFLGTEAGGESDREWQAWLRKHPDAPDVLEADWQRRAADATQAHRPLPPPIPH